MEGFSVGDAEDSENEFEDANVDIEGDIAWIEDLENALNEAAGIEEIVEISNHRPLPRHLRARSWKVLLGIEDRSDQLANWDGLYNLEQQEAIRNDCTELIEKFGNCEEEKVALVSDVEAVVTFYCKSRDCRYCPHWMEILAPLLALNLSRGELYNAMYTILNKFIPKECDDLSNGRPFSIIRLILLYHEPELCSYLDTRRVLPADYCSLWLETLFGLTQTLSVVHALWDILFQMNDPFIVFFLCVVVLVNAKEQIMTTQDKSKEEIIELLRALPSSFEEEDIEDFISIASFYASLSPESFKKENLDLFLNSTCDNGKSKQALSDDGLALCFPVSVNEVLARQRGGIYAGELPQSEKSFYYLVVDCRTAEQYNTCGHLPTAFHLDNSLMLQHPERFADAVNGLLASRAKSESDAEGSEAVVDHLTFLGSGEPEDEPYLYMLVSHFLQKHCQYVSIVRGGFKSLLAHPKFEKIVIDRDPSSLPSYPTLPNSISHDAIKDMGSAFMSRFSSAVKVQSSSVKDRLGKLLQDPSPIPDRHVSPSDKISKPYRGMAPSVFSIGDEEEDDEGVVGSEAADGGSGPGSSQTEIVHVRSMSQSPEVLHSFQCQEIITSDAKLVPCYLMLTSTHLFIMHELNHRPAYAAVQSRRPLNTIVKITSKKRKPEVITFKYGSGVASASGEGTEVEIWDANRFFIPNPAQVTSTVKQLIVQLLDAINQPSPTHSTGDKDQPSTSTNSSPKMKAHPVDPTDDDPS